MNHRLEMVQRSYSRSLQNFRRRKKYSQESLALEAQINRTHMYKLEAGLVNPTLFTMVKICDVLGVSFSRFARDFEKHLETHSA
jgi:DNA-binding XRE family transcriptional regulator